MTRLVNMMLCCAVIITAYLVYAVQRDSRLDRQRIAAIQSAIAREKDTIRLLEADWSHLSRPARLEMLAKTHLGLAPSLPEQIGTTEILDTLPLRQEDMTARIIQTLRSEGRAAFPNDQPVNSQPVHSLSNGYAHDGG